MEVCVWVFKVDLMIKRCVNLDRLFEFFEFLRLFFGFIGEEINVFFYLKI